MSRTPDWNPDILLAGVVRRAAEAPLPSDPTTPDPALSAALRANASNHVVPDVSEADWRLYQTQTELQRMRARVKHLESALRAAGRVLQPYLAGNGR